MNELQAASILDPNTRREALQPYELDCVARLAAVEEACRVAARTLRLTHNSGPLVIDTSILSDEQCKHLLEEKGKAAQYPLQILPGSFGGPEKIRPLTLEQLREMAGYILEEYGKTWIAYAYPPANIDREKWVSVEDHLPPEHDSIFKRYKGTDKWVDGMFESLSEDVIVSVKFGDGKKKTYSAHTKEGKWTGLPQFGHPVVTHWMPFPDPTDK